uniref:Aminotransferase-like plant mobile domain-containing protein n=1 Tax=Hordeum vulgare subsp. vulgare TaxID=112509 RepID=A0A8I6WPQ9_HORVV
MMDLYGCRFPFDYPLLSSLADKWQRTNTFHLPVGEMTITLEDVEKIFGLPLDGDAVADNEVNNWNNWKIRLLERFSTAERKVDAPPFVSFKDEKCIPLSWLAERFSKETVNIYLEAYLVWLFGSAMFANHCSKVQTWILPCAFLLANSPIGSIPKFSWGSVVLATTYRGLSNVCTSKAKSHILTGCPMLVQLWSYERFKVGCPRPKGDVRYHRNEDDETDGPTLGSKWLSKLTWVKNTRRSYPEFVRAWDAIHDLEVTWVLDLVRPETFSLCTRDSELWLTKTSLVCDVITEEYCPHRVMRQFGLYQSSPLPLSNKISSMPKYSRKGNTNIDKILREVSKWARAWKNARMEKIDEHRQHYAEAFQIYKKWFLSNTRAYLVSKEEGDPIGSNMYPMHRDRSRRACVDILTEVISHMDYYKNEPEITVQEFKTVFDYLSKKCKMAIDHDAMPTPAPIPQLRATDSDTSEHLEGEDDRDQFHTPERDSGTSDHLEGEDKKAIGMGRRSGQ